MTIGNPLLATYANDEVIRTYEYVNSVFVPLGVSSTYSHNPSAAALAADNTDPYFTWLQEDSFIFLERAVDANNPAEVVLRNDASQVNARAADTYPGFGGRMGVKLSDVNSATMQGCSAHTSAENVRVTNMGAFQPQNYIVNTTEDVPFTDFSKSYDQTYFFTCQPTGFARVHQRISALGVFPVSTAPNVQITGMAYSPSHLRVLGDNRTCVALQKSTNSGKVYTFNINTAVMSFVQDIDLNVGAGYSIWRVNESPDGRFIAISFKNGTNYITRIWRRTTTFLVLVDTYTSMGRDITWSADGNILVDCNAKKALIRNGNVFDNHDSAMINIGNGVFNSALSAAPVYKSARASVYLKALENIGNHTLDFTNLKFTLLTASAAFNEANTTIGQVTNGGAYEVTGGAWPVGGIKLDNVVSGMVGSEYDFKSDLVKWLAFGSSITWRYAVVYDATSGQPLVWFDYYGARTVAQGKEVNFTFAGDAFLNLIR